MLRHNRCLNPAATRNRPRYGVALDVFVLAGIEAPNLTEGFQADDSTWNNFAIGRYGDRRNLERLTGIHKCDWEVNSRVCVSCVHKLCRCRRPRLAVDILDTCRSSHRYRACRPDRINIDVQPVGAIRGEGSVMLLDNATEARTTKAAEASHWCINDIRHPTAAPPRHPCPKCEV